MNTKLSIQSAAASYFFSLLLLVALFIGTYVGYLGGSILLDGLDRIFQQLFDDSMFLMLAILSGAGTLILGVVVCIWLLRLMIVQRAEVKLLQQPTPNIFMKFVSARLVTGFFVGLTINALIVVIGIVFTVIGILS